MDIDPRFRRSAMARRFSWSRYGTWQRHDIASRGALLAVLIASPVLARNPPPACRLTYGEPGAGGTVTSPRWFLET